MLFWLLWEGGVTETQLGGKSRVGEIGWVLCMVEAQLHQFGTVEMETSKEDGKTQLLSGLYSLLIWHIVLCYSVYGGGLSLPATGSPTLSGPPCSTICSLCNSLALGIACISMPALEDSDFRPVVPLARSQPRAPAVVDSHSVAGFCVRCGLLSFVLLDVCPGLPFS